MDTWGKPSPSFYQLLPVLYSGSTVSFPIFLALHSAMNGMFCYQEGYRLCAFLENLHDLLVSSERSENPVQNL